MWSDAVTFANCHFDDFAFVVTSGQGTIATDDCLTDGADMTWASICLVPPTEPPSVSRSNTPSLSLTPDAGGNGGKKTNLVVSVVPIVVVVLIGCGAAVFFWQWKKRKGDDGYKQPLAGPSGFQ
jgi:hypothetical protein